MLPLSVHPVLIQASPPSPGWAHSPQGSSASCLPRWPAGPHRLSGPGSLLPCQPALQRPWGEDWRELELQASLLAHPADRGSFTAPLAARQGPLVLLKGQEPVSARASVGSRAGSMGGPQLRQLQSVEGQLPSLPLINSLYRPNSCISHFYLTEKVALTVQILKNQNAFKKGEE